MWKSLNIPMASKMMYTVAGVSATRTIHKLCQKAADLWTWSDPMLWAFALLGLGCLLYQMGIASGVLVSSLQGGRGNSWLWRSSTSTGKYLGY